MPGLNDRTSNSWIQPLLNLVDQLLVLAGYYGQILLGIFLTCNLIWRLGAPEDQIGTNICPRTIEFFFHAIFLAGLCVFYLFDFGIRICCHNHYHLFQNKIRLIQMKI